MSCPCNRPRRLSPTAAIKEREKKAKTAGRIEIHWSIAPAGDVVEQCLSEDTVHDPALAECVNELVRGSHYPASSAPFNVSYPFEFEPGPAPGPGPVPPPTQPT